MAIEVAKIELKTVQDASGLEECIRAGQFAAKDVVAVIGKTEGNGGVNDFTRILADQAFRRVLIKHGCKEEDVARIPMVWSGGCDGVITPHATVFAKNEKTGPASKARLTIGAAMSAELKPEDIGRPAMVEKVADGVKAAMRDAGISDPKDVHYVQTKTPLLTIDSVRDAESRGHHVACEVHDSMGVSNGTTALGIAVALGEIKMPKAEAICKDLDLYSSVASCSSGVELTQAQIVLIGNRAGAGGRYPHRTLGHARRARHGRHLCGNPRCRPRRCPSGRGRKTSAASSSMSSSNARRTGAEPCAAGARSCSTIPTSIITGIPRAQSAAWRRRRSAIRRCSSRSTRCTRARRAADR